MQFQRADAFAMTDQAASDHDLPRRAAGLDTEWDGRKSEDDALDQRMPTAPSAWVTTRSNSAEFTVPV